MYEGWGMVVRVTGLGLRRIRVLGGLSGVG